MRIIQGVFKKGGQNRQKVKGGKRDLEAGTRVIRKGEKDRSYEGLIGDRDHTKNSVHDHDQSEDPGGEGRGEKEVHRHGNSIQGQFTRYELCHS